MTVWLWAIVALATMGIGALASVIFQSLREMARTRLEELAAARGSRAVKQRVGEILRDVDGHATAVGVPRVLCHLLFALAVVQLVAEAVGDRLVGPVDVVIGLLIAGPLVSLLGLIVPNSIAAYAAEEVVLAHARLVRAAYVLSSPLRAVERWVDAAVRRVWGRAEPEGLERVQADIMSVIDEAQQDGSFDDKERSMIEAVVGFKAVTVKQIMTPRTAIEAMELSNNLGEVTAFIRQCRHSRIPVYQQNLDNVSGMFYIKDLVRWLAGDRTRTSDKPFDLKTILRPALFVPESKTVRELLGELLARKVHVAMVVDEYGGVSGMVTFEDIVEEVFGEIQDEYESAEDAPRALVDAARGTAELDGRMYIEDANDALAPLGVALPTDEAYDTIGGLVLTRLGRIPQAGADLRVGAARLLVTAAEPTRVLRVVLSVETTEGSPDVDATEPEGSGLAAAAGSGLASGLAGSSGTGGAAGAAAGETGAGGEGDDAPAEGQASPIRTTGPTAGTRAGRGG